jgi:hypothetical protein
MMLRMRLRMRRWGGWKWMQLVVVELIDEGEVVELK